MAFVPFDNTGKLCYDFTWNGVGVSICLWFVKDDPPSEAEFQALADEGKDSWNDNIMPVLSSDIQFNGVTLYDMSTSTSPLYTSINTPAVAGGVAVDSEPNQSAVVVNLKTNNRGRSYRGRFYLPGVNQNDVVDSLLTSDSVDAIGDGLSAFRTDIETLGWTWVVASQYTGGAPRTLGVTTPIELVTVRNQLGTQRRRVRKA